MLADHGQGRGMPFGVGCRCVRLPGERALLAYCPSTAQRIYVGKTSASHTTTQKEINDLLVSKGAEGAYRYTSQGGDPFLFGREGKRQFTLQGTRCL